MKVKFLPQNIEVEIKPNESVLSVAQDHGIHIQSVCKGIPSCAECRVNIKEGETNVIPPLQPELELIGTSYYIDQRRLSCQLRCFGDVVVDLSEQVEKENRSTKNPQGRFVKEREDSKARMGNILEELGDDEKEELIKSAGVEALSNEDFKSDSKSSSKQNHNQKKDPKNNQGSNRGFSKNTKQASSGKGQNKNNKNKRRRRRGGKNRPSQNSSSTNNSSQNNNKGSN